MRCKHAQPILDDYLQRRLPREMQVAIAEHLSNCSVCRQLCLEEDHLQKALAYLPKVKAPDDFEQRLRLKLQLHPVLKSPSLTKRFYLPAIAAAVLLLAIGALIWFQMFRNTNKPDRILQTNIMTPGETAPILEVPIFNHPGSRTATPMLRFISKEVSTGNDVYVEMPAVYKVTNFQNLESHYVNEVSH